MSEGRRHRGRMACQKGGAIVIGQDCRRAFVRGRKMRIIMHTGKLSEAALQRSVLGQIETELPRRRFRYGADCARLAHRDGFDPVYTAVSRAPGFEDFPEYLVTAAVNNIAAAGGEPRALVVHAVLPVNESEDVLKAGMRAIAQEAGRYGMQVIGGHTEVSPEVLRPQYLITGIGDAPAFARKPGAVRETEHGRAQETEDESRTVLQPGDGLVLTKWVALAGTAALAMRREDELRTRFPLSLINSARQFAALMPVLAEARIAVSAGSCAMHDLSQGGVFGALWEMAQRAEAGLDVDLKRIPIRQETVEICEYFDINPYCLYSAGSLLIGTREPERLVQMLLQNGIHASVIGYATGETQRIIRNGEDVRYLDRPKQDEWYRFAQGR